jgi:hypothetical protein
LGSVIDDEAPGPADRGDAHAASGDSANAATAPHSSTPASAPGARRSAPTPVGWGATGLTFFDDEATGAFGTNEEPMMCVAIGVDALRR